jgi:ribosome biogenesis GTPase
MVFVTFAAQNPDPNLWLLDRFLVASEAAELSASIVINKIDLVENDTELRKKFQPYEKIGYRVFYISAGTGIGLREFIAELPGKISAFTGPSGVGKSSLLNAIQPGLKLKTGEIGIITNKGHHTTTTAELIPIERIDGAWIADTPGLRQMEFWEIPLEDIEYCFPEFEKYRGHCQFGNCSHKTEPDCAVREASRSKEIDPRRYKSYLNMIATDREFLNAGERA